ncbi:protein of unknown function [Amycolatopsis lurida]|uniref:DUF1707 domain-containing protein n=1 Tax=Amycolatopsis lurida NRRL 2430 TaxID=1460371 RepID=A0A2P2G2S2_AMYLU|nr:DUF1707 domain-containing protein [Amycolatopsis lurida]KFU83247.1 hypothetical protein BB31_01755 [Amycolatopsis lurida NRRL 2430]SED27904.1 protein of unknown function [Amycolatopsis lurida]
MSEVPSPRLRISDQDRESALAALGEHMTAGRIDIDEFGERSARVTAAKTRGDLSEVFADLPEPRPRYDTPRSEPEKPASPWAGISPAQRVMGALLPILFIATIALIITTGITWWFILVPIGISAVGEGIWGKGWENSHKKLGKQRRRELDG